MGTYLSIFTIFDGFIHDVRKIRFSLSLLTFKSSHKIIQSNNSSLCQRLRQRMEYHSILLQKNMY